MAIMTHESANSAPIQNGCSLGTLTLSCTSPLPRPQAFLVSKHYNLQAGPRVTLTFDLLKLIIDRVFHVFVALVGVLEVV